MVELKLLFKISIDCADVKRVMLDVVIEIPFSLLTKIISKESSKNLFFFTILHKETGTK